MASGLIDLNSPVPQANAAQPAVAAQAAPGVATTRTATATNAAATQAGLTKAALNTGEVAENQTVAGQVKGIIDANGPLSQQAEAAARGAASARGLSNSSMAIQAGQTAVLNSALPIAQQDAGTYSRQALQNQSDRNQNSQFNAAAGNQNAQFNTGEQNSTSRFNATQATSVDQGNAQAENQASQFNANAQTATSQSNAAQQNDLAKVNLAQQNDITKANLDVASKSALTNLEASYKTLIQSTASAQAVQQQLTQNLANVQNNKDLDPAARQVAINQQVDLAKDSMNLIGAMNNLNMDGLLTFGDSVTAGGANAVGSIASPTPVKAGEPVVERTGG